MVHKLKYAVIAIVFSLVLPSCVIHSQPPFVCFASGCIQNKKKNKGVAMKMNKNRTSKAGSKTKGETAKKNSKTKQAEIVRKSDGIKQWDH